MNAMENFRKFLKGFVSPGVATVSLSPLVWHSLTVNVINWHNQERFERQSPKDCIGKELMDEHMERIIHNLWHYREIPFVGLYGVIILKRRSY